jgi:predicted lipopolysaccharide heptosyltransferase III
VLPSLPEGARVLIVRLRSLGDTLLLTPALRALKAWRPDLRLSLLLYERFAPVLEGNPDVDEVVAFNPAGLSSAPAIAQVAARLRRGRLAASFNLHGGTLSALLTRASGAPHRVSFEHFRFGFLYTGRSPHPRTLLGHNRLHTVEAQLALFYAAGLPQGGIPPTRIYPQEAARRTIRQELSARGIEPGTRYAVLHPVANFRTKEWPFDRYAALAGTLERQHGLVSVFVCGAGEGSRLDAVARHFAKPLVRFNSLTIPGLVALIEGAQLFVGNDSGPAHIAAALNRPAVVLFGSSNASLWHPWQTRHEIVQNDYACNPCRGDRCYAFEEPECILSIRVQQVEAAVERLLASSAAGRQSVPVSVH